MSDNSAALDVGKMSPSERLSEILRRSESNFGPEVRQQIEQLRSPTSLAIMAGTLAVWGGSHAFGVGEGVDIALLLVGAFTIGLGIGDVLTSLYTVADTSLNGRTDADLNKGAQAFSHAVVVGGITTVSALLLHKGAAAKASEATANTVEGRLGATECKLQQRTPQLAPEPPPKAPTEIPPEEVPPPKAPQSLREQYLGRTPGKASRTGREVIARMEGEGKIRTNPRTNAKEFQASNGKWYDLSKADMAHKTDAVTWWNDTGRAYGAKSPEVRAWMLDSNNYYLELNSINRSQGASLGQRYLAPSSSP
jgi:hypothetical protein